MPDAAFDCLPPEDQATVLRWLDLLGFEPDEIDAVPPLKLMVDVLASVYLARKLSPPMGRVAAWATAGELIGRRGLLRRWYEWQRAACADSAEADGGSATVVEATTLNGAPEHE